ncbi:RagB/SusD family nutrient uptake outer membrane protein [Hymenobacter rubripertinctus]|uniref:RagB/SusD family nutrient uptake outer membrane protein n=1 Tax=Hymenobacter rubripertinctus TaxID=2029981 RepID=A0A418QVG9_9BACT|nr:RagB/SusD family nutrient uptake outer membrane protein [Hymenobacter rubripertinctus]RIY09111.1 RagB/SusD family nutrient uptake outer membrane protein [Hymenobacter rubripertinctus]
MLRSSFHKFAMGLVFTAMASGCDVLTQDPPTAFTVDETYADADRIQKSLFGVYDGLQDSEFLGGRALIYSDIRSDDTNQNSTFFGNVPRYQQLSTDGTALNAWAGGYRTIFAANSFIQNLAINQSKVSAAVAAQYTAEAKYVRALSLFTLVNLFAQPYNFTADASHLGVVIQLTAPKSGAEAFDDASLLPRSSVKEVYDQIIKDLIDITPALPATDSDPFSRVARASKGAAQGLLARVYLYKGDFANAAATEKLIIDSGLYKLNASPATAFTSYTTAESIFSVAMNLQDNPNTNNAIGQHYGIGARGDIGITGYTNIPVSVFAADDKRRSADLIVKNAKGVPFTNKFTTVANWVPIVRYPEVLLTRAEGLAQTTGVTAEAVSLLNQVRDRSKGAAVASYTVAGFANKQALVDAILLERRLELAFEGFRLYDLLRYKQGVAAHDGLPAIAYGDSKLIFPIPNRDILNNPKLVQNKDY